jgi:hypothetical protein
MRTLEIISAPNDVQAAEGASDGVSTTYGHRRDHRAQILAVENHVDRESCRRGDREPSPFHPCPRHPSRRRAEGGDDVYGWPRTARSRLQGRVWSTFRKTCWYGLAPRG